MDFSAAGTPVQIVYELFTPITEQTHTIDTSVISPGDTIVDSDAMIIKLK